MPTRKIPDDSDDWESGKLVQSLEHARPAPTELQTYIDANLALQPITLAEEREGTGDAGTN